jgi:molecular chaperone GrpE
LQLKYANLPLVRDLLEVIDNLQRAIGAANEDEGTIQALREGVEMVNEQLLAVLDKYACKPIEAQGNVFDPNFHEAIAQTPSDEFEQGKVAQEVATGYMLHDRVVRPSSVIVSTGSSRQDEQQ